MAKLKLSENWNRRFHRKYLRPRDAVGNYLPLWALWTRAWDNKSHWIFWPNSYDKPIPEHIRAGLSEPQRRVIRDLVVVIVAAALVVFFGGS